MDIALHRSASDIEEDLEYYFSEQRDKHNQIRPSDDIRSFTTDAANFTEDPGEDGIGNVFSSFRIVLAGSNLYRHQFPSVLQQLGGGVPASPTGID